MINKASRFINQKIFIIIFICCTAIACFSIAFVYSNRIIFSDIDKNEGISIDLIVQNNEKYHITINYPITRNNKVNKRIKAIMEDYINKVKNDTLYFIPESKTDKFKLIIETDIERVNIDIISFIFLIDYSYGNSSNIKNVNTVTYNLKSGKQIFSSDFFDSQYNYINELSNKSKESIQNIIADQKILNYFLDDITFSKQNSFDGYSFTRNHIAIYFNSNKISSKYTEIYKIKIPWDEVKHLLKQNVII